MIVRDQTISSLRDLGTPSADDEDESFAVAINDLGIIAMYAPTESYSNYRASFKLPSSTESGIEHTKDEDFLQVGAPDTWFQALLGINNLNQAIGTYSSTGGSVVPLHLNYMANLSDLVEFPSGWTLWTVSHINDKGEIAGTGQHSSSVRGIILTPQD